MKVLKKHRLGFYYYIGQGISGRVGEIDVHDLKGKYISCETKSRRLIFLDRDGVINVDSEDFIKNWSEFIFCSGSLEAIRLLAMSGFLPVVISNQSGINRKILTLESLDEMTFNMVSEIERSGGTIKAVCYCPHKPEENCQCRKPKTAMLEFVSGVIDGTGKDAFFVGDRKSDVETAINFGLTPILIDHTLKEDVVRPMDNNARGFVCSSLLTAVVKIVLVP